MVNCMISQSVYINKINKLFNDVVRRGDGKSYIYLHNSEGKEWYFDASNYTSIQTGLNIYEPMAIKGRLIKGFLPIIYRFLPYTRSTYISTLKISVRKEIENIIISAVHCRNYDLQLDFFLGTPCEHQKIVIQISQNGRILGYAKVSDNYEVVENFKKEYVFLQYLAERGVEGVPHGLTCQKLNDMAYIYIQSSLKEKGSYTRSTLNDNIFNYIKNFNQKTKVIAQYEHSEIYQSMKQAGNCFMALEGYDKILDFMKTIQEFLSGRLLPFCAYHGDFTPWNTFYRKDNELCMFDFEYAGYSYFPMMDIFHWFTSVCILKDRMDAKQTFKTYQKHKNTFEKHIDYPDIILCIYLIDKVRFFIERTDEPDKIFEEKNVGLHLELLGMLLKNIDRKDIENWRKNLLQETQY